MLRGHIVNQLVCSVVRHRKAAAAMPLGLFACVPGALKPFDSSVQMRDLGFHPLICCKPETRRIILSLVAFCKASGERLELYGYFLKSPRKSCIAIHSCLLLLTSDLLVQAKPTATALLSSDG